MEKKKAREKLHRGRKSCLDCAHLRARVPVGGPRKRILWDEALVSCAKGHLVYPTGEKKRYKNVLRYVGRCQHREAWDEALICPDFDSMED